jgi:site-specific recombinase XerD
MARKRTHGTGSVVRQSSGIYVFYWTDANGKRCKKSLRTKSKAEALGKAKDFEKAIQATDREEVLLQSARARQIIRSKDLPMGEVWQAFLGTNPTASEGTLRNYERALRDLSEWLASERPSVASFTQIDQATAIAYLEHLWESGPSANTYNYRRNALGHITKKLAPRYHIDTNPWLLTERKAESKQQRMALTSEQVADFLALFEDDTVSIPHRQEFRVLAMVCLYAGMRLIDGVNLGLSSIDLAGGKITYTPRKTARTGRKALVPILPPLRAVLSDAVAHAAPGQTQLLPTIAAVYERSPDSIQKPLVSLVQSVTGDGLEHNSGGTGQRKVHRAAYGAHSLRHTFASMAAMAGAKPAYLAAMLGDNITTVQKYYVQVGFAVALVDGFADVPKMIEAKAVEDPERARLHRLTDELPLEKVREVLAMLDAQRLCKMADSTV